MSDRDERDMVQGPHRVVNFVCHTNNHVWTIVYEGADPEPGQACECGERRWHSEFDRMRTGQTSYAEPVTLPAGLRSPEEAP